MRPYILVDKVPVQCDDLEKWVKNLENISARVVSKTVVNKKCVVSTVFLGLDHNYDGGEPILFETVIFGGPHDQYLKRYSTWAEAEKGHKKAVKLAKKR